MIRGCLSVWGRVFYCPSKGLYKEQFWRLLRQAHVLRNRFRAAVSSQIQTAKTAKVHFQRQNTGAPTQIDLQCVRNQSRPKNEMHMIQVPVDTIPVFC